MYLFVTNASEFDIEFILLLLWDQFGPKMSIFNVHIMNIEPFDWTDSWNVFENLKCLYFKLNEM